MPATATQPFRTPQRQFHRVEPLFDRGDLFVVCIGLANALSVTLVGMIPGSEVLILLAFPFLISQGKKILSQPGTRTILILMGIWLLSQIVSDLVNGSPMDSRLKGMARVLFFAADFSVFSILIGRNRKRIVLLATGMAGSQFVRLQMSGLVGTATAWKFGEAACVSTIVLLFGSYLCARRRYDIFIASVLVLIFFNFRYGFRSQIAVDMVSVGVTLPIFLNVGRNPRVQGANRNSAARLIILLLISSAGVWLSQKLIQEGLKHSYFSEDLQQKFETQSSGKLGVLLGARPEIPVALRAIVDAPLLGHGSYAMDPKYTVMLQEFQYKYGYSDTDEPADFDMGIPTHSHLTGSWVEGGVLSSFLWFYILYLTVRASIVCSSQRPPLAAYYVFAFITLGWDILFSPFGFDRRVFEALYVMLMINLVFEHGVQRAAKSVGNRVIATQRKIMRPMPNRLRPTTLPRPNAPR